MNREKQFSRELRPYEVEYGVVYIQQYRELLPPPGESIIVMDEKDRRYQTKMHSKQPRIDGLTNWYKNHPKIRGGDMVKVQIINTNLIKLAPINEVLEHKHQKSVLSEENMLIDELISKIQQAKKVIDKKINEAINQNNYETAELYLKLGKELSEFKNRINTLYGSIINEQ